jgi:hypothetical protein
MKRTTIAGLLLGFVAGFLLWGCGGRSPQQVAAGSGDMAKWEYKFIKLDYDDKKAEKDANALGAQGWELFWQETSGHANAWFKRPAR